MTAATATLERTARTSRSEAAETLVALRDLLAITRTNPVLTEDERRRTVDAVERIAARLGVRIG